MPHDTLRELPEDDRADLTEDLGNPALRSLSLLDGHGLPLSQY
jgi:hypothetical protein